jgi:heme iron utilization protein
MSHLSRLDLEIRRLLTDRPIGALGTLEDDGAPAVSMVPFAWDAAQGLLVLHVSGLSPHTRQMALRPAVSLLVVDADGAADMPQALPRVTLAARAAFAEPGSAAWAGARGTYLARHPQAALMDALPDFRYVLLRPTLARQIAGFGAARTVVAEALDAILASPEPAAPPA